MTLEEGRVKYLKQARETEVTMEKRTQAAEGETARLMAEIRSCRLALVAMRAREDTTQGQWSELSSRLESTSHARVGAEDTAG